MSAQDMYRSKQENVAVTEEYSALLQEIAKEKGCLFYDWFWASGGRTSILEWRKRSLAGVHLVSLTPRGYRLKAEMLGEALLVAFTDTSNQPFEVDVEAFQEAQIDRLLDFQTLEVATSTTTQEVATTNSNIRADSPPVVERLVRRVVAQGLQAVAQRLHMLFRRVSFLGLSPSGTMLVYLRFWNGTI